MQTKLGVALMIATTLAACGPDTPASVAHGECKVFIDNLLGVEATTPDGERRLNGHYEAGIAAGCWTRAKKI